MLFVGRYGVIDKSFSRRQDLNGTRMCCSWDGMGLLISHLVEGKTLMERACVVRRTVRGLLIRLVQS